MAKATSRKTAKKTEQEASHETKPARKKMGRKPLPPGVRSTIRLQDSVVEKLDWWAKRNGLNRTAAAQLIIAQFVHGGFTFMKVNSSGDVEYSKLGLDF